MNLVIADSHLYFSYIGSRERVQTENELSPRQDVRICLSAFRDAHVILPRLSGRARLRRQAFKLQWWCPGDTQVFDVEVSQIGKTPFWTLNVDEGYGIARGYRVIFCRAEPLQTVWILSIMAFDETITLSLIHI